MFDAQLLMSDGVSPTVVYSPWMARGADNAVFTVELIAMESGGKITVDVFHKNSEDVGDGTVFSGVSLVRNSEGRSSDTWSGLKELVRYRIKCQSDFIDSPAWILFRMLSPVWFDDVLA